MERLCNRNGKGFFNSGITVCDLFKLLKPLDVVFKVFTMDGDLKKGLLVATIFPVVILLGISLLREKKEAA